MTFSYELYVLKGMIKEKIDMLKPLLKLGLLIFIIGDVILYLLGRFEVLYLGFWLLISLIIAVVVIFFFYNEDLDTIYIRDT